MELRVSNDDGKELDEREYLMQLMMAQESGMIPSGLQYGGAGNTSNGYQGHPNHGGNSRSLQDSLMFGQAQQSQHQRQMPPAHSLSAPLHYPGGGLPFQQQQQQQHSQQMLRQVPPPPRQNGSIDTAALIMNLQETIAAANGGGSVMGGNSNSSGNNNNSWQGGNGGASGGGVRISDPGLGDDATQMLQRMAAAAASGVNPMLNRNRISDSGQMMGMVTRQDLSDLLPLVSSAMAGGGAATGGGHAGLSGLVGVIGRGSSSLPSGSSAGDSPHSCSSPGLVPPSGETEPLSGADSAGASAAAPEGSDILSSACLIDEVFIPPQVVMPGSRDGSARLPLLQAQQQQQQQHSHYPSGPNSRDVSGHLLPLSQQRSMQNQHQAYPRSGDASGQMFLQQQQPQQHLQQYSSYNSNSRDSSGPLMFIGGQGSPMPSPGRPPYYVGGDGAAGGGGGGSGSMQINAGDMQHILAGMLNGGGGQGIASNNGGNTNPGNGGAYVNQLVAQLQEQGVVNSKEQLIQSLSQLLGQLLVNNN